MQTNSSKRMWTLRRLSVRVRLCGCCQFKVVQGHLESWKLLRRHSGGVFVRSTKLNAASQQNLIADVHNR